MQLLSFMRRRRLGPGLIAAGALISIAAAPITFAQPMPPDPPRRGPGGPATRPAEETQNLKGVIQSYNYAPGGEVDALMIKQGDALVQVNLPPRMGAIVPSVAAEGDEVTIVAAPRLGMPGHSVYELVSLTGKNGKQLSVPKPGDERIQHAEGNIKQLNYDREGRVNGAVLDNGDFVHLPPDRAASLKLNVGDNLKVDGVGRPMLSGHQSIEAYSVNGTEVRPLSEMGRGRGPMDGPGARRGMGPMGRRGPMGGPEGMEGPHRRGAPGGPGDDGGPAGRDMHGDNGPPEGGPDGARRPFDAQRGPRGPHGFDGPDGQRRPGGPGGPGAHMGPGGPDADGNDLPPPPRRDGGEGPPPAPEGAAAPAPNQDGGPPTL